MDRDYKADDRVCFVDRSSQEKHAQLIAGGELVDRDYQADVQIFIVEQDSKADITITRKALPTVRELVGRCTGVACTTTRLS